MAYTENEISELFDKIFNRMVNGESLSAILRDKDMPSRPTFYSWIKNDENLFNNYARATSIRADFLFDEILEIADRQGADMLIIDGLEVVNHNVIQRNRLQVDARKWAASKMNPKKYGEKVDLTSGGEKITPQETTVTFINARKKDE